MTNATKPIARAAALGSLLLAIGCGGDTDPVPVVTVLSAAPMSIDPARDDADDLTIMVEYTDGDADLGEGLADVYDCRTDGVVIGYDIPPIASPEAIEAGAPIEGTLSITVNDIGDTTVDSSAPTRCADLGVAAPVAGEVVFCVVLTDAAGNESDGDCTAPVAVESP